MRVHACAREHTHTHEGEEGGRKRERENKVPSVWKVDPF